MEKYRKVSINLVDGSHVLHFSDVTLTVESDVAIGIQHTSIYENNPIMTFIPWSRIVKIECVK